MIEDLKAIYDSWNSNQLHLVDRGDHIVITTPFVDLHHDLLQLVFSKEQNNIYKLSDDGYIINELEMLGIEIMKNKKRKEFFQNTLNVFGIRFDEVTNELWTHFDNLSDYPRKQINLLQCVLRVSDMLLTSRNSVISIFFEEISEFFEKNDVIFSANIGFTGKTGQENKFDFVVPKFKSKPEQIIKAINTPSSVNYKYPLLSFIDIQESRKDAVQIVFSNDLNVTTSDKFKSAFVNYNIKVLNWSERQEWIQEFKIG